MLALSTTKNQHILAAYGRLFYSWPTASALGFFVTQIHQCQRQVERMGTRTMPEHHGAWWSYPIYASGFLVAAMSPEQWLMVLSILAVLTRLAIDVPTAIEKYRPKFDRFAAWLSRLWP